MSAHLGGRILRNEQEEQAAGEHRGGANQYESIEPPGQRQRHAQQRRTERDEKRRQLLVRLESGQADLDLLKLPLYPYQVVGTLFLAFTERALLADDMGLGKTCMSIAAARLLKQEHGVNHVLVITPASVKYQWGKEIERFSDESYVVVQPQAIT